MKKYPLYTVVILLLLYACEKEIDLSYRSIDPLYVVEARVTNETTEVIVTQTRDMDEGRKEDFVTDAVVTISEGNGPAEVLRADTDGHYRSGNHLTGVVGKTYTVCVKVAGQEFTSTSHMNGASEIKNLYFRWLDIMTEKMLFCSFEMADIAGEENYYCYRLRRNGENYRWNVLTDKGFDGRPILVDIPCMTQQSAEDNKEEDWDDILYDGDEIELEVQTIDRRTYDYLYSVGLNGQAAVNPIEHFTGGCLGYFSAYSTVRKSIVFYFE